MEKKRALSGTQAIPVLTIIPMHEVGVGESHFRKRGNKIEFALSCPSSDLLSVPRIAEV